jgi:hypothetical protein
VTGQAEHEVRHGIRNGGLDDELEASRECQFAHRHIAAEARAEAQ